MPTITAKHYDKALDAISKMETVIKNEMLVTGTYVTDVIDERRAEEGAVCGGRKACAIGSLWLGYGVQLKIGPYDGPDEGYLPGVGNGPERRQFIRNRPALRIALEALNEAALAYAERRGWDMVTPEDPSWPTGYTKDEFDLEFRDPIERLFEGVTFKELDTIRTTWHVRRQELLKVTRDAKRRVRKALAAYNEARAAA